jgi:hypothetical protein
MGYKWQPNDTPSIRKPFPPELGENETLLRDLPGRCGIGLDCHSHHFCVTKRHGGFYFLLVMHGGGQERIPLFSLAPPVLAALDSMPCYLMAHTIYSAHRDGDRDATLAESVKWRKAAAEKRIKTKKLRGKDAVKVWIEPTQTSNIEN